MTFYTEPTGQGLVLGVPPALASWDATGSAGQKRSTAFLDHVGDLVAGRLPGLAGPLCLRLNVGLPGGVPLLETHDLDNYLFPLVPHLTKRVGRRFASVWATKRHATGSSVLVTTAAPTTDPGGSYRFEVETTEPADGNAYKEQIRDQVESAVPLTAGAVDLQIAFTVGPGRAWPNLWKASIDALGPILGHDDGASDWNNRDGRITRLGLHCTVDPTLGHHVRLSVRASNVPGGG